VEMVELVLSKIVAPVQTACDNHGTPWGIPVCPLKAPERQVKHGT
jgi:hypothetical protein